MQTETTPFDPADYLSADKDQLDLLRDAFASGNTAYIVNAIGVVARARNVSELARETGLTRAGLYKAFGPEGDPKLSTVIGVLEALGFKLSVALESRPAA